MVKFVADSSCDLFELPGVDNFVAVPLVISTDERTYTDNRSLDLPEMLDYLAAYHGRSYTACPSPDAWLQAFGGADEIYVVTITSGLSGTTASANVAKGMYLSEHPEAKVLVIDSLSTGPEMRMILEKLVELKNLGKTFEEVEKEIAEYTKHTHLYFVLKSLHNLSQNGRVSKVVASAVGFLHINILGIASPEGTIAPINKARNEKKVLETMMDEMAAAGYKGAKIRISHVQNEEFANRAAEAIRNRFGTTDVLVYPTTGLCSFYAERGGILIGCECD